VSEESSVVKAIKLVRELEAKPYPSGYEWSDSSVGDGFGLETPNGSVDIISVAGDGRSPYRFLVYNPQGDLIHAISSFPAPSTAEQKEFNRTLASLYEKARRQALDIDHVFEGLFRDLGIDTD
jgi:hypothetical protein